MLMRMHCSYSTTARANCSFLFYAAVRPFDLCANGFQMHAMYTLLNTVSTITKSYSDIRIHTYILIKQGGPLASCIHNHIAHGDPSVVSCIQRIMRHICAPIFYMIRQWVCEGELNGISSNATIANMTAANNSSGTSSGKIASSSANAGAIKSANSHSNSAHQHAHSSGSANSSDFFIVCNEVSNDTLTTTLWICYVISVYL
jgi:Gamma tubulin complex component N-terminal